jgi:predicted ATPase
MAEEAHEGLRGATGQMWRERLTSELDNLRAALDWFITRGDADAALSLASGMASLWFVNSDYLEGARWLSDALNAKGSSRPELAATAQAWHGYFVCMSSTPAAGIAECEAAVAALRSIDDPVRQVEARVLYAAVLMRANEFGRSLEVLGAARDLLERAGRGWLLALHDLIVAWNQLLSGQTEEAEQAARSCIKRFAAEGEIWLSVEPLNILAGVAEARGDLDGAATTYESVLERSRIAGQRGLMMFSLLHLAALRARQGDDVAADRLHDEAIALQHQSVDIGLRHCWSGSGCPPAW